MSCQGKDITYVSFTIYTKLSPLKSERELVRVSYSPKSFKTLEDTGCHYGHGCHLFKRLKPSGYKCKKEWEMKLKIRGVTHWQVRSPCCLFLLLLLQ